MAAVSMLSQLWILRESRSARSVRVSAHHTGGDIGARLLVRKGRKGRKGQHLPESALASAEPSAIADFVFPASLASLADACHLFSALRYVW